jgi:hypothetical protein
VLGFEVGPGGVGKILANYRKKHPALLVRDAECTPVVRHQ